MRVRIGQDASAGLLFMLIGLGALWIGADYNMGTPQKPGTGVLPRILSWCLIGGGGLLILGAIRKSDTPITGWAWRPVLAVTAGTAVFGLLVDDLGLIITMILSMTLCALGALDTRWREFAGFTAIMIVIGVGTFIWLLGMPIPTWPAKVPSFLRLGR